MSSQADAQKRLDQVKQILGTSELYQSRGVIDVLEAFLGDQIKYPEFYDIDANLAILKLYLIFPKYSKVAIIRQILTKALMHLPATDFDLCLCQIPLPIQQGDPTIRALIVSENRLQTCRFREFWQLLATEPELVSLANTADLKNSVRRFMAGVISLTYHTITMADSAQLLDLPTSGLQQFCREHLNGQWVCDKTGIVTIAKTSDAVTVMAKPSRPLFSPETLNDCLTSLKKMQSAIVVDEI